MKVLLTAAGEMVSPRFDLTLEVNIAEVSGGKLRGTVRSIILPGPSGDELCSLILKENVEAVICGGVNESHHKYLTWKKIKVYDRVIGQVNPVLDAYINGGLKPGAVIRSAPGHDGGYNVQR